MSSQQMLFLNHAGLVNEPISCLSDTYSQLYVQCSYPNTI